MKIELKNIKHLESLSEETNCYTADIWVDGVKTAAASNHGHGGCDMYHAYEGQRERLEAAEAWAKSLPPKATSMKDPSDPTKPWVMEQDLESVVGDILTEWLIQRDLKKILKKPTILTKDGRILQWNVKPADPRVPALVAKEKKDGDVYLNALPFADAYTIFRKQTA